MFRISDDQINRNSDHQIICSSAHLKLIIFDCDGTLVDSETICNTITLELVNQCSPTQYTLNYALNHWAGMTLSNVLQKVREETGCDFPADVRDRYVERCNKKYKTDLKPVLNANDVVEKSHKMHKICVASNGERNNVIESLGLCGFLPTCFLEEQIFTKNQVERGKPFPDLFLLAAEKMGVAPSKCLVIEDSVTGVTAAAAAGMEVWGFTGVSHDPESQEKALKNAGASRVFHCFIHIGEALNV